MLLRWEIVRYLRGHREWRVFRVEMGTLVLTFGSGGRLSHTGTTQRHSMLGVIQRTLAVTGRQQVRIARFEDGSID